MHLTTDQLADLATGSPAADLRAHLSECTACAAALAAVTGSAGLLGRALAPTEPMPSSVAARLSGVIEAESERRASGRAAQDAESRQREHAQRLATGTFANAPTRRRTGIDVPA